MIYFDDIAIIQNHFPDNTLSSKAPIGINKTKNRHSLVWYYENDAELFTVICLKKHYYDLTIDLYLPYVPHARMDRVKNYQDIFTLKYFCEVINSLNFAHVYVQDVHSNVTLALLDRVVHCEAYPFIRETLDYLFTQEKIDTPILFFPDEGASKRYSELEYPYITGVKKRDWETGKINSLDIINNGIDITDKNILIIDDICSYGGTFSLAAKTAKEHGAKNIYLYITHCEDNILSGNIFKENIIKKVFTRNYLGDTDSIDGMPIIIIQ